MTNNLRLEIVRGRPVGDWTARLVGMWLEEGVLARQEAERRVREAVCALLGPDGTVFGVTTAYPGRLAQFPEPVWHLRMFVRRSARGHQGLAVKGALQWKALETTFRELEGTETPLPFRGAVLVTENPKFWSERWIRAFAGRHWNLVAKEPSGQLVYFRSFTDPSRAVSGGS